MFRVHILEFLMILFIVSTCQARVINGLRQAKLSLTDPMPYYYINNIDGHPGTYSFGYDISDPSTGNTQFRTEERYPNGTVAGSYGYVDAWGTPQRYRYIADARGYRITKERPFKPYIPPSTITQIPVDSSITWSRPKISNKKQNNINSITNDMKMPELNILKDKDNSFLLPPSYYVED
ncbi:uncharacterized protein LOC113236968 [Hyposmocoma kahamanoa]|uniref:uncharacterized protein LOC113236968 n=1 Tax=Hyposmocoma kahamanoa TaxID=1477025 RepID=UPI000E6D9006|nr:uncharacterized protein LOC113236968 [Hyposmocoma kahamanoa]